MNGYHFTSSKLRNGKPLPPVSEWLEYTGKIIPCESGLHMSEHPFDALRYAPGNLLHRVELEGELQSHGNPIDKWVGSRRKILASVDAANLLREYGRWCALQVIDLWDAPNIVREYLETGDEHKRDAAWTAARSVARSTVRSAVRYSAWTAVLAATSNTPRSTAWPAAWSAAKAAAKAAADAAEWSATWFVSKITDDTTHWVAARNLQRQKFAEMVSCIFSKTYNGYKCF